MHISQDMEDSEVSKNTLTLLSRQEGLELIWISSFWEMAPKTKELTTGQRHSIFVLLSSNIDPTTKTGLKWGILTKVAKDFDVDKSTIAKFWRKALARLEEFCTSTRRSLRGRGPCQ